jgi:hypothetical protein
LPGTLAKQGYTLRHSCRRITPGGLAGSPGAWPIRILNQGDRLARVYGLAFCASAFKCFPVCARTRHVRDVAVDPLSRGGDRVSNYRVRQVLKLHLRDRQEHLMVGLATFLTDDSRTALVGVDALMDASDQARNTFRQARRELEKEGKLASQQTGVGRGKVTEWTALCLPETAGAARKGVSDVNPVSVVDPLLEGKGVNADRERGSTPGEKGGQGQRSDQQEPRTLNRRAKPYGSAAATQTAKDQGQGQEPSVAKSQRPRLPDGPGTMADDAQQFRPNDAESTTAGSTRARKPEAA